jgi:hypothetical protein
MDNTNPLGFFGALWALRLPFRLHKRLTARKNNKEKPAEGNARASSLASRK